MAGKLRNSRFQRTSAEAENDVSQATHKINRIAHSPRHFTGHCGIGGEALHGDKADAVKALLGARDVET